MIKKLNIKFWTILIFFIAIIYVGIQVYFITDNTIETDIVVKDVLTHSIVCNGIIGKDETDITYNASGLIGYIVQDGQRVSQGDIVANVFSSHEQMLLSAKAQLMQEEIDVLTKSQISSAGTDANMIINQAYVNLYSYIFAVGQSNLQTLKSEKYNLQMASNKVQIVTQQAQNYVERLDLLTAQYNAINAQHVENITAPVSGYFVSSQSSSKNIYTYSQLMQMSPLELQTATQMQTTPNSAQVAGKVIHNYKWSFFISVTKQEAEVFKIGSQVKIAFPNTANEALPAYVENVIISEQEDIAKVELSCNYINSDVVALQQTQAEIQIRDYEGLLINKQAVRVIEGVTGVYVQTGTRIDFCKINIIYESENYVLVSENYVPDENEIKMYDNVVINGKELYDGKLL